MAINLQIIDTYAREILAAKAPLLTSIGSLCTTDLAEYILEDKRHLHEDREIYEALRMLAPRAPYATRADKEVTRKAFGKEITFRPWRWELPTAEPSLLASPSKSSAASSLSDRVHALETRLARLEEAYAAQG